MKISTLFATAAIALTLAGSAAAQTKAAVPATPAAPAITIAAAERCEPSAATDCNGIDQATDAEAQPANPAAAQVDEAPLPVPELETSFMLMLGLVVLGITSRRRVSDRFDG